MLTVRKPSRGQRLRVLLSSLLLVAILYLGRPPVLRVDVLEALRYGSFFLNEGGEWAATDSTLVIWWYPWSEHMQTKVFYLIYIEWEE